MFVAVCGIKNSMFSVSGCRTQPRTSSEIVFCSVLSCFPRVCALSLRQRLHIRDRKRALYRHFSGIERNACVIPKPTQNALADFPEPIYLMTINGVIHEVVIKPTSWTTPDLCLSVAKFARENTQVHPFVLTAVLHQRSSNICMRIHK